MVKKIMLTVFLILCVSALAFAQMGEQDRNFIEKAAAGSMAEIELGQLASEKAENPEVKQFGERMIEDHSQKSDKLRSIAEQEGIQLPQQLESEHQQALQRLSQLSGREFDREYMRHMVEDHQKDIDLFNQQAEQGQVPELKQFASESVPILSEHLQMAKEINQQVTAQK